MRTTADVTFVAAVLGVGLFAWGALRQPDERKPRDTTDVAKQAAPPPRSPTSRPADLRRLPPPEASPPDLSVGPGPLGQASPGVRPPAERPPHRAVTGASPLAAPPPPPPPQPRATSRPPNGTPCTPREPLRRDVSTEAGCLDAGGTWIDGKTPSEVRRCRARGDGEEVECRNEQVFPTPHCAQIPSPDHGAACLGNWDCVGCCIDGQCSEHYSSTGSCPWVNGCMATCLRGAVQSLCH